MPPRSGRRSNGKSNRTRKAGFRLRGSPCIKRAEDKSSNMTNKIRIGVVGLGIMGEQYVRIYNAHPLSTITAICTRNQERLDEVGNKYGIAHRFTDFRQLVERADVDAVCI